MTTNEQATATAWQQSPDNPLSFYRTLHGRPDGTTVWQDAVEHEWYYSTDENDAHGPWMTSGDARHAADNAKACVKCGETFYDDNTLDKCEDCSDTPRSEPFDGAAWDDAQVDWTIGDGKYEDKGRSTLHRWLASNASSLSLGDVRTLLTLGLLEGGGGAAPVWSARLVTKGGV